MKKQSKLLHNKLKYKLQLDDLQEKLLQQEQAHAMALAQSKQKADGRYLSLKADLEKRVQEYQEQASEACRKLRVEHDRKATEERRQREKELELQEIGRKANESCAKAAQVAEENTTLRNQLYNLRTEVGESLDCCPTLADPHRTTSYGQTTRSSSKASKT